MIAGAAQGGRMQKRIVVLAREAGLMGMAPVTLRRATRRGELIHLRHGAYAEPAAWEELTARARHLELVHALAAAEPSRVFSHWSAAALHDLPVIGEWPDRPHVRLVTPHGISRRVTFVAHEQTRSDDAVPVSGVLATSVARTAVDVAAVLGGVGAVVILDAAVARVGREVVDAGIRARRPFRGVARVDRAMKHVTGLAESPLESLSMLRFCELGFAIPEQQREFLALGERYRVDFYWPGADVIGEADGWTKYQVPDEAFRREKRREDALRTRVRGFARWDWGDAWGGVGLAARLAAAGVPRTRGKASANR